MSWRTFWGITFILLGIVLLALNPEILPGLAWNYIVPLILVLVGIALLIRWRAKARPLETVSASAPLEDITRAEITFKHAVGQLNLRAGDDPTLLFTGAFEGGVQRNLARENGAAFLEFKTPSDIGENLGASDARRLRWDLQLHPTIPTALKYEGGAAETKMDLSRLHVIMLEIHNGASSADVALPIPRGTLRVVVQSDAASVKLRVPPNALAAIHGAMGMGALAIDPARFPPSGADSHQSGDYASATDRIEITIQGGVGSVEIR